MLFPQPPHNNEHCVRKNLKKNFKTGSDILCCLSELLMSIRYINVAVCMIWSLTYHNLRHSIEKLLHSVQRIERNINLQIFTKWTNCGGNCITGNVARIWRKWGVKTPILKGFCAQEHDTYTTIRVSALLSNISFTKYISVYLYKI